MQANLWTTKKLHFF